MPLGGRVVTVDVPEMFYPSLNWAGICAVLTCESATIGEVNK